ncbi:pro-resilin-like [Periplaneta americana]|uniref:pro-resilin-like n=1 Tax=Periplaneta americana TaxID=6978 RepID=UPI0037E88AE4
MHYIRSNANISTCSCVPLVLGQPTTAKEPQDIYIVTTAHTAYFSMAFFKRIVLLMGVLASAAVVTSEPQSGPANTYLPPDEGYQYQRPNVPFHPTVPGPSPRPTPDRPVQTPVGPPRPTYDNGNQVLGDGHGHHDHHEPGMPFDFNYAVKDDYYGTDYSHNAISDGDVVKGEYRVQLPDGRLQIVRYTADWKTGFHADVSYEGQASYPDTPRGGYNYPGPGSSGGGGGPSSTYGPPGPSSTGY